MLFVFHAPYGNHAVFVKFALMVTRGDATGLDEFSDKIEQAYIDRLADAGEKACADAVAEGNYQNITGNLRSSIGYVIGYDGKVIREGGFHKVQGRGENMQHVMFTTRSGKKVDFWAKGKFGDGSEGSKRGREMAHRIIMGTSGYSYVLVVGMEYASYVSSRGYNVWDSAQLTLGKLLGTTIHSRQWQG